MVFRISFDFLKAIGYPGSLYIFIQNIMIISAKLCIAIACGTTATVFLMLTVNLPNTQPNGFKRSFLYEKALTPESSCQVSAHVREIISRTSDYVYLSTDIPDEILIKDNRLNTIETANFDLRDSLLRAIGTVFNFQLDSSNIYLFASNIPAVVRIGLHDGSRQIIPVPGPAFSYAVALSENSFIIQQFLDNGKNTHFIKHSAVSGTMYSEHGLSLPSTDGGLSTDGQLHYDRSKSQLLYMHYYNNAITSFDTNLVLTRRFHTIDTISGRLRLAGAPLVSNQKSCVYNEFLLVCSNLKADNETFYDYRNNIPVDIYEIDTGIYSGSFYLPLSNGKLVKSMKSYGNSLAILYHDNRLSLFKLPSLSMTFSRK